MYSNKCYIIFLTIFFCSFLSLQVFAQNRGRCKQIKNKEAQNNYNEALNYLDTRPKDAIDFLLQATRKEPKFVDAYFLLGQIYFNLAFQAEAEFDHPKSELNYTNSENYFNKALDICPAFADYQSYYFLGEIYYKLKKLQQSKANFNLFLAENKTDDVLIETTKKRLKHIDGYFELINNPIPFNPTPLKGVNTSADEFLPLITPDGEMIFYTRRTKKKNVPVNSDDYLEELTSAKRINPIDSFNEEYADAQAMPAPFNDGRNMGGATITIDNKEIFITICDYERANYTSYKNCDLYTSVLNENKWSALKRLNTNINSYNTFEGQPSITSDGKTLYFSSNRPGGFGGYDIYKSERDSAGEWSKPENLGGVINTPGDEKTPFIHSDNRTLYYSTNGLGGVGGFDLFKSQFLGNNRWTEPKNIGYPLNTEGDEIAFMVSTNGKKIYFSSMSISGAGGWDIFASPLHEAAQPTKILFVKGKIVDEDGSGVEDAKVELTNIITKESTEGFVDSKTGKYAVTTTVRKNDEFIMTVTSRGYFFNTQYINPNESRFVPPTTVDIKISEITINKPIRLENVHFATNSYALNARSIIVLEKLIDFLKANPKISIEIQGHTDNVGAEEDNLLLSHRRVKSVQNYLTYRGILPERLTVQAFGENKPVTTNNTEDGKALNRRVEFVVTKK